MSRRAVIFGSLAFIALLLVGGAVVINNHKPSRRAVKRLVRGTRAKQAKTKKRAGARVAKVGKRGRWGQAPESDDDAAMLNALGYVDGSVEPPKMSGVTLNLRDRVQPGNNFYTSGHGGAVLMDPTGKVLHTWAKRLGEIDPEGHPDSPFKHWRRAKLLPDGDVIAIFEGKGIFRLDKDSNVKWAQLNRAHHDIQLMPDGSFYTLTRTAELRPTVRASSTVVVDYLAQLDAETGAELGRWSILDAVLDSPFASEVTSRIPADSDDVLHTNSVEILDGRAVGADPAFAAGNLLTSMRATHTIGVMDLKQKRFVWLRTGTFLAQHDPSIVGPKRLMLFDNNALRSRVLVFDLPAFTERVLYPPARQTPLFSQTCGVAEQQPNGNVLITESDAGRVIEVNPEGEAVWEYYNPARAGDDDQYIAAIFELVRLPPDTDLSWAE